MTLSCIFLIIDVMIDQPERPPENVKLGKAKAMENAVLGDGVRLPQKAKVRYWVQRQGARLDYFLFYKDKIYKMSNLEFVRRFKVIIKGGEVSLKPPPGNQP